MMQINAFVGYDKRFPAAYGVTVRSLIETASNPLQIQPIVLDDLIAKGLYFRPTRHEKGQMFDEISDAPMSTEFAISRFFIPLLNDFQGHTIFCDSDFLFRKDIHKFLIDDLKTRGSRHSKAVWCVPHEYAPPEGVKMDGQMQTLYRRKNWSSFMIFNNAHPKNKALGVELLNKVPGRDLHAFSWLDDEDIGFIDPCWNWLEGHSSPDIEPAAVHFTRGTPDLPGYESVPYADEWRAVAERLKGARHG